MRPRTRQSDTSIAAYYAMVAGPALGEQQRAILAFLAKRCERDWTRNEIAKMTGIRLASVCARCFELIDAKVIVERAPRLDSASGRACKPLALAPAQGESWGDAA